MRVVREWWTHRLSANTFLILDDKHIITGGRDAYIRLWDLSFTIPAIKIEIPAHMHAIYSIIRIDEYVVTASMDKSIRIWRLPDLTLLKHIDAAKGGHRFSVNGLIKISRNAFFSYSDDSTIIKWKIN